MESLNRIVTLFQGLKPSLINFWSQVTKLVVAALGWIGMMFIHVSTIPMLIAANSGTIDKLPSVDFVLFIWAGLAVWFLKALMDKDSFMAAGIGLGFAIQAALLAMLVFK